MISNDDVNNYIKIKSGIDRLRTLVEQSELWVFKRRDSTSGSNFASTNGSGDKNDQSDSISTCSTPTVLTPVNFTLDSAPPQISLEGAKSAAETGGFNELDDGPTISAQSLAKYKELFGILSSMTTLCLNGAKRKSDQRLLRNMGVHLSVLDLTKISYDQKNDSRMRVIMREAHRFLQTFCKANKHNQVLLHDRIDFVHFPANEWEAATGAAIFQDNLALCQSVSERLVQNYTHGLESTSKVIYLQFLQKICVCDGMEIRKNQDMILNELLQSELLQYSSYCNTDKMGIDELCLIMQKSHDMTYFGVKL